MWGMVLILAIEAAVLLAVWRWDGRNRAAQLRERRQLLGHSGIGSAGALHTTSPSSLAKAAG